MTRSGRVHQSVRVPSGGVSGAGPGRYCSPEALPAAPPRSAEKPLVTDELAARLQSVLGTTHRIERELARGGMSRVFLATDLSLGRQIVVKVLSPELASEVSTSRFRREVELEATLQHPHILPLLAAGSAEGITWLTAPYVPGESLRHLLAREGRLPMSEALTILREVADALAYAHRRGVLHRDVKPENILLLEKHALLTDFGVARLVGGSGGGERLTDAGHAVGTPAYMSPEQYAGETDIDARSDIYGLGVVGYEMLTGQRPFKAADLRSELMASVSRRPRPLTDLCPGIPHAVSEVIERCLAPDPAARPASAEEVRDAIAVSTTTTGMAVPQARRRWRLAIATVVLLVLIAAALVFLLRPNEEPGVGDPNVIAVLPFRVAGADPALGYLREGVLDLAYARLGGEGGLRAVSPQTVMGAWRREGGRDADDVNEEALTRIAGGVGAGRILVGSVVGTPARMEFSAVLRWPGSARRSARGSVVGPVDSLTHLIDRLMKQLLAQEEAGFDDQELSGLTSTSLPALRTYLGAQTAYRQGRYEEAVAGYERALQQDTAFALAALGLYRAAGWLAVRSDQRERALAIGWRHRDRLNTRDRAVLESLTGLRYPIQPTLHQRFQLAQRALELAPDLPELWYALGDAYFHYGRRAAVGDADAQARRFFRGAVDRDSSFAGPLMHLVQLAARTGDTTDLSTDYGLLLRYDSDGEAAEYVRWLVAHVRDDQGELRRMRARFAELGLQPLTWILLGSQQDGFGLEDAERAEQALNERRMTPAERRRLTVLLRDYALNSGRPAAALRYGDELVGLGERDSERRRRVFDVIFSDGDRSAAVAAVAQLGVEPIGANRLPYYEDVCARALWHASQGSPAQSERDVAALRSAPGGDGDTQIGELTTLCTALVEAMLARRAGSAALTQRLATLDSAVNAAAPVLEAVNKGAVLFLGRSRADRGEHAQAAATLDRTIYFGPAAPEYWSSFLRERGHALAAAGNHAEAAQAFTAYLHLRSRAEPSLHGHLAEVRRERDRLQSLAAR